MGQRVKLVRRQKGWSQQRLADEVGCSQQAITSLENGRTRSFRELPELARALEVTAAWLKTGAGEKGIAAKSGRTDAAEALVEYGQRVGEARSTLRLSVAAAARAIMADEEWRDMERGAHWPDPVQLDLICGRLSQSLDWLVRGIVIAHSERPLQGVERVTIHEQPPLLGRPPAQTAESE